MGNLRDEYIEHVVKVDADLRFIVDSCEEESLTMFCASFRLRVGRAEYKGIV